MILGVDIITDSNNSGGITFFGALTLIFVIAKITGYVTWPWWMVISPVLAEIGIILILLCVALVIAVLK